jgi:pimeloyl-ACP methyl ester carboxylesterase
MSMASIRGISMAFDDEGDGDPLVLVHGHPLNRSMWRPQVERLSRSGWQVIAPDLRGYGRPLSFPEDDSRRVRP